MTAARLQDPDASGPERQGEVSLRPRSFADWIGQAELVANLAVFVRAARERGQALDHMLFCGPPGLGKTTLAQLIARELDVTLHASAGPAIERKDLAGIVSHLQERDVLFIDEIHRLSPVVEENLYPAMEDFKFDLVLGQGPQARSIEMPLPRFTLIGATTRSGLMTGPMRDRFGFSARLGLYTIGELCRVVRRSADLLDISCDAEGAQEIASRSRGTPRIANRMLRRVRDFAQVEGNGRVDRAMARGAMARMGVDERGLDELDRRFLSALVGAFDGGPVGIETLAAALGEECHTLETVCEPFLMQEGFVKRTPRGREATPRAVRQVGAS